VAVGGPINVVNVSQSGKVMVTGGEDTVVSVWIDDGAAEGAGMGFALKGRLYHHTATITSADVSTDNSVVVSADASGVICLWDLNRLSLVSVLPPASPTPVQFICIDDSSGRIISASGRTLSVWNLNGKPLAEQRQSAAVTCVSCSQGGEWIADNVIVVGQADGAISLWSMRASQGQPDAANDAKDLGFELTQRRVLQAHRVPVTALLVPRRGVGEDAESFFSGGRDGEVFEWALPRSASSAEDAVNGALNFFFD